MSKFYRVVNIVGAAAPSFCGGSVDLETTLLDPNSLSCNPSATRLMFLRAWFADRRICLLSQTEALPPNGEESFSCREQRFGELQGPAA